MVGERGGLRRALRTLRKRMEGGNRRETLLKDEEEIVTWNKPIDRGEGGNTGYRRVRRLVERGKV